MTKITNRSVLITGGAAGIGKLIAESCLKENAYKVILWDINERNLIAAQEDFRRRGYEVACQVVDVSNAEDVKKAAEKVREEWGAVDILFNNAGIVVGKPFHEHSIRDIDKTMGINVSGVMYVALEFLPAMMEQEEGHLVNVASAAGLMANPNMSVYAASKWAVVGWSESVRLEQEREGTGVQVTTVMPSYINTGMFDGVKAPLLTPTLSPETIVEKIMKAVKNNEIHVQEPFMVKSIPLLRGVLPTKAFDFIAGRLFGVYNAMDHFVGRPKEEAVPDKENLRKEKKKTKEK